LFLELAANLLEPAGLAIAMKGPEGPREAVVHPSFAPPEIAAYELAHGRRRTMLIYRRG
jgi:hypothetical protein